MLVIDRKKLHIRLLVLLHIKIIILVLFLQLPVYKGLVTIQETNVSTMNYRPNQNANHISGGFMRNYLRL